MWHWLWPHTCHRKVQLPVPSASGLADSACTLTIEPNIDQFVTFLVPGILRSRKSWLTPSFGWEGYREGFPIACGSEIWPVRADFGNDAQGLMKALVQRACSHEPMPSLPASSTTYVGLQRTGKKAWKGWRHSSTWMPPLTLPCTEATPSGATSVTPWHCCYPWTQWCSSMVGQVTEVHPHLLSILQILHVLPDFAGQQQCCTQPGQACSRSDVLPQLFRLQSCLKDFSCFWNRGKKKETLTHVYTWGAGREITQGKWSGWW